MTIDPYEMQNDRRATDIEAARQRGRVEGQVEAIEKVLHSHDTRLDIHDKRISIQEKITWGILGAIALVQSADVIKSFLGAP